MVIWKDLRRPAAEGIAEDRPKGELLVIEGGGTSFKTGFAFTLPREATIGRASSNTIILADPFVSSNHAKLVYRDEKWWLTDLGSRNGTWINGERVDREVPLYPDDILTIGQVTLKLTTDR
ncbi:MAG: FHA domain-containing protein [Chloroflexota bacterium]|jgi:hypothetical protein